MGGSLSHEFHLISKIGEDKVVLCNDCQFGYNQEVQAHEEKEVEKEQAIVAGGSQIESRRGRGNRKCSKCQSANVTVANAIEVSSN